MTTPGNFEGRDVEARAEDGITRREALRRGTMAGIGLVWVAPQIDSFTISAQTAQATSGVGQTDDRLDTDVDNDEGTEDDQKPADNDEVGGNQENVDNDEGTEDDQKPADNDEVGGNQENVDNDEGTEDDQKPADDKEVESKSEVDDQQEDGASDNQVQDNETDQGAVGSDTEVKGKVVSGDTLPFTGLPIEQLLPLAGGAIATGAAAVRLSRARDDSEDNDGMGEDTV